MAVWQHRQGIHERHGFELGFFFFDVRNVPDGDGDTGRGANSSKIKPAFFCQGISMQLEFIFDEFNMHGTPQ